MRNRKVMDSAKIAHHSIFSNFPLNLPARREGYRGDFSGAQFRSSYDNSESGLYADYPAFDEDYLEWVTLCQALHDARGKFVMVELGAGYGRWVVRAGCFARHRGLPFHVVAVEADPTHFAWLEETLTENGIRPDERTTLRVAVSAERGFAQFYTEDHQANTGASWYGQMLVSGPEPWEGYRTVQVVKRTLTDILEPFPYVDLIDMDVQGEELAVISSSVETLNAKVRRLQIGTHSDELYAGLVDVLSRQGWVLEAGYPGSKTSETPWGAITFGDGSQSWYNPRQPNALKWRAREFVRNLKRLAGTSP